MNDHDRNESKASDYHAPEIVSLGSVDELTHGETDGQFSVTKTTTF